jgi:hypothetical protein
MIGDAAFSASRKYRYWLKREWHDEIGHGNGKRLAFIGLNPSTANAKDDDPTIRRVISFARREGYSGLVMLNLFAIVSSDPKLLLTDPDPNDGTTNDLWLRDMVGNGEVVFCWGAFPEAQQRAQQVIAMFPYALCFGKTRGGHPLHPLFLPANKPLTPFAQ